MGIPDYDMMFDLLDTRMCGYLTVDQLQDFQTQVYLAPLDQRQIEAAVDFVCGKNSQLKCSKEYFGTVVEEIGRRVLLEESIAWDFKCLDVLGCGRISLSSALLLFKCVHGEQFSLDTWNRFVLSRLTSYDDVSFDEIKLWLCEIPTGDELNDVDFDNERENLESQGCEKLYGDWSVLEKLQEDSSSLAQREAERNKDSLLLKQKSRKRIRRLEKEGINAILFDQESDLEDEETTKGRQQVGASDLVALLKLKYETLREKLLLEQIQHDLGEGIWLAMSQGEQEERLVHLKLRERRLSSSHEGSMTHSHTAGSVPGEYQRNLLALLGPGRINHEKSLNDENARREMLENEGKTDSEIHNILLKEWREKLQGKVDGDKMLDDLCLRYQSEKDTLKSRLCGEHEIMNVTQRLQEYKLMYREYLKASLESSFESACLVVGVAETATSGSEIDRHHFGKELQHMLADRLLTERRGHKLPRDIKHAELEYHEHETGQVELYEDVIKALERKHRAEMEMMVHMLQGKDASQIRADVRKMTNEERENQFVVLKTQRQGWRNRSSDDKLGSKSFHLRLLQEAVIIVYVNLRLETKEVGADKDIAVSLLANLLHRQEIDAETLLAARDQTSDELLRIRREQEQMYDEEWLDNLSAVVLGTSDVTRLEDDIIKLLEAKYDCIRHKVLEEALKDQIGSNEWEKTPVSERYNIVTKAKVSEKKYRLQKRFSGALKLLGDGFSNSDKIMSYLGESRQLFVENLKSVLEKRKNRLSEGLEIETENYEVEEKILKSSGNLWKDIDERYRNEKQSLIKWLQEGGSGPREVNDTTVRLQQQKRLTEQEPNMLCALLVLGLCERHRRSENERLSQDDTRRHWLAEEHFVLARLSGSKDLKEIEDSEPNKDVLSEWMDAVLREMERKHRMERRFLSLLLLDNALEDLRVEAREISEDERQKRLTELKDERDALDLDEKGDQDMNHTILEMACAFKIESRRFRLKNSQKESRITDDTIFVSMVADLHTRHSDEREKSLEKILDMSKEELATIRSKEIQAYKSEHMENVAAVLLCYDGLGSNDEILQALENKYDALRDKLLLEALRKQLGDDEWQRLSERERQMRLMKMKLEAKRLQRESKLDELAKLLGEGFAADVNLRKLLGENREKYEQQLRERLARRRERLAKGLPAEECDEELDDIESLDGKSLLDSLDRRFEEERDALMAKLLGANNQFLSERERQALLARLKREQLKARLEDKFDSAALVLGLAERQRKDAEERLMSDRARHEQLARQRLEERRNRAKLKALGENDIVKEGDESLMQEAVLKFLENKHCEEREVLIKLLENEENHLNDLAQSMTPEQREEHVHNIKLKKNTLNKDDVDAHREMLQEAAIMKLISRLRNLEIQRPGEEVTKHDAIITLMADLQQEQDKESEILMALLPDKDKKELVALQSRLLADADSEVRTNLMTVFGTPEQITNVGEEQLLDALDSKYDTLRDKLLSEALMKEMGAAEWQALSEQERQARLVKMKLEERRLRREGKFDELQALLGAAFDAESNLQDLMVQNKARYKERMKEKLEKRRQRLKEGMSKDEVSKMEAEEDEQFEEELKKEASLNPLIKLVQNYDQEKEALLEALRNKDGRFASERHRQAELARLRREERKARHEDKFDTAALVLGLAQAQKANLEEVRKKDRLRQEQLARERLAARRKKKATDVEKELREKEDEQIEDISDKENLIALQEAVLKELEKKQECEREVLEKLLQEEQTSQLRKKTEKKSKEERTERLVELKGLREQWRDGGTDGTADSVTEHDVILREAVCLNIIKISEEMKEDGKERRDEEVHVAILANLQQIQDQEAEILLRDLSEKSGVTLTQLRAVQHQARRHRWYDNIAVSLLGQKSAGHKPDQDNIPSEEELLGALEEKYDALKDKLIAESLMNELGAAVWGELSERERQAKILKIRLQEKRLRKEGKIDEANRLFGEGLEHAASLSKLMGETKAQQRDALKRRLQKLRELKAAGIEITTEEAQLLEDGIEEETIEEEVTTEDVIKDLQSRYEEEKKALLASLKRQDKRFSSERQRQLELAKLRREQKKIAKEDKFDAAALVLGLAKQQEAAREASYRKDRARHEQLARERLAALKAKRAKKEAAIVHSSEDEQRQAIEAKLQEEQDKEKDILSQEALELQKGGVVAVQEAILKEVEKKHSIEIKMLSELLDVSESDADAVAAASYLNHQQRDEKMADLYRDFKEWKTTTVRASKNAGSDFMSKEEKEANILRAADRQVKLMRILKDGIVLKVLNVKEELSDGNVLESNLKDELAVMLVANLQEKQSTESRAVENILAEKEEAVLNLIKDEQRRIRQECIVDNLSAVILKKEKEEPVEENGELSKAESENDKQLAEMETELEVERQRRFLTGASEDEINAAVNELKRQQEAKKQALNATLEHQRRLARAKLEARRRRRDDKQYEEDIATSLLMMAEQESSLVREKTMIQRSKQGESLQERLARRREERAKRKAQEELERNAEESKNDMKDEAEQDENISPKAASADRVVERTEKLKGRKPSLPEGFSMKREKTVVDVEVSEDKKKEIVGSLLREHTTFGMGIERERKRQEDILMERRLRKKSHVAAAAATIIGLGERQKTMVEQKRKEERERQLTMVRDRISRVRHERTMTMKEPRSESRGFEHILTEKEKEGLSPEEKMKLIAAKMEQKFKVEERRVSTTLQSPPSLPEMEDDGMASMDGRKSTRLDEKGKEKKLKERLAARKKAKRGERLSEENEQT